MNEKQTWHLDDYDFQGLSEFIKKSQASNEYEWQRACDLIVMYLNFPFFW
jgi:hypothetical protein